MVGCGYSERVLCKSGAVTGLPPFFSDLFMDDNNKEKADAFQVFLRENQLSGYQRVVAVK